ncbi:hypothetical protein LOZ61_002986 [Ophidiomyces ophidiicola]|uniref:uncharacterized protein n=1 Tax=Ophidiomyces ophidiicola TaxID=1387563 RepID=UPI0020C5B269|nr:uncharacterized protein LOZ57_003346 [Ophidiomyces ophidiicola]KAI1913009.1 hypothetical protein LOZ61_002986 [Ophidiomyces ophidiicola]KAI1920101.1 hypothetical protein LOZ60_006677 [Ophidiomyces ophidiicola]KAI1947108.1 hypothetical protein LOZ57_003346 [Ophidiomyces ophidiicola]KAI1958103.1 hypothetical protein LOZ59_003651 [Ophidiomyces ophidiicola]KAI2013205.1 hypothetical protein LOZ49_002228 [Ophidiomyces ophidiicola]
MAADSQRSFLRNAVASQRDALVTTAQALVRTASPNLSGDTRFTAEAAIRLLQVIPHAHVSRHQIAAGVTNVVVRIPSGRPGKRLVFNGHLDTSPLASEPGWTASSLGAVKDGKLFGRGVFETKGALAAAITAAKILAEHRDLWRGEIVLTLAGDGEVLGARGTGWLLDNVAYAKGDVVVCTDAASPRVVGFGENGAVWIAVEAEGVAGHSAQGYAAVNAIKRLRRALDAVEQLEEISVKMPAELSDAIDAESHALCHVTVSINAIAAGSPSSVNLVPGRASAQCDIRLPIGLTVDEILARLRELLGVMDGIKWTVIRQCEPSYTSPMQDFVRLAVKAATDATRSECAASMHVGASDARFYRAAGVPAVVVGCAGSNMGAADEYIEIDELVRTAQAHALIAYGFLKSV